MSEIQLFHYSDSDIRTVVIKGKVWFVAKDVCDALSVGWEGPSKTLATIRDDWKMTRLLADSLGRKQMTSIISEEGVYKLAFRSRKPEAEKFTDWIAGEVLPSIRKHGRYVAHGVLPIEMHARDGVQKEMSKSVNAFNYEKSIEAVIDYNVKNCMAHTGARPEQIKARGKALNLKLKDRNSAKAVLRKIQPETACAMSLADNLVSAGHQPDKVFNVSKKSKELFKDLIDLGVMPAELLQS